MEEYKCENNKWLKDLYDMREKWCIAFSKEVFSGGILSSQRGESTNNALSCEMKKTSRLSAFFMNFMQVCRRWRDNEIKEDFRSLNGEVEVKFPGVQMLLQARRIYTAGSYSTLFLLKAFFYFTKYFYFLFHSCELLFLSCE